MDMVTTLALPAMRADIWGFVQFKAPFRNICIAEFEALTVRTSFASVEIAPVDRGIITNAVAQAGSLFDTIVFPFGGEPVYESTMMKDLTGDRRG